MIDVRFTSGSPSWTGCHWIPGTASPAWLVLTPTFVGIIVYRAKTSARGTW